MKKTHFQLVLTIIVYLFPSCLFAQDSEAGKIKEIYLSGNLLTFNNFGLQFKS